MLENTNEVNTHKKPQSNHKCLPKPGFELYLYTTQTSEGIDSSQAI